MFDWLKRRFQKREDPLEKKRKFWMEIRAMDKVIAEQRRMLK